MSFLVSERKNLTRFQLMHHHPCAGYTLFGLTHLTLSESIRVLIQKKITNWSESDVVSAKAFTPARDGRVRKSAEAEGAPKCSGNRLSELIMMHMNYVT